MGVNRLNCLANSNIKNNSILTCYQENRWKKKGLGIVPLKYGVRWLRCNYNVMVTIYNGDGTVAVSHGGVEMGQGINTKVCTRDG